MKIIFIPPLLFFTWKVDLCSADYYLLHHPHVINLYLQMRLAFTGDDPFETYNLHQRKALCDKYLASNVPLFIYEQEETLIDTLLRARQQIPAGWDFTPLNYQLHGYERGSSTQILTYRLRTIFINLLRLRVKMFPCIMIRDKKFFLSYGFKPNYVFVIGNVVNAGDHQLIPLIFMELGAQLDEHSTYNRNQSNQYFWNLLMPGLEWGSRFRSFVPQIMELCSISEYEHLRLCCSVTEKLRLYPIFELNISKVNVIANLTNRCVRKAILNDQTDAVAYGQVLPCAINTEWSKPQFYLLRDTNVGRLYVLREAENTSNQAVRLEAVMNADNQLAEIFDP